MQNSEVESLRLLLHSLHTTFLLLQTAPDFDFISVLLNQNHCTEGWFCERDMLEGRSCVVRRLFPSSENNWSFMKNHHLPDLDIKNGKRPLQININGDNEPLQPWNKVTKMLDSSCHRVLRCDEEDSVVPQMDNDPDQDLDGTAIYDQMKDYYDEQMLGDGNSVNYNSNDQPSDADVGDLSDSGSLLPRMNQDSSIACLSRCSRSDYGSLASLNRSFRDIIRSGELYRWRRLNGTIEHWVYFSCALLEWEAYDPIRQRWMHLPRMASNECFMCSDKESLAVGTELLVFGRELRSHVIYRYSLLTNSWSSGMRMNAPRCLFGSASLGEIAILAGGCDSDGCILDSAELYNSENQTWEMLPSMNKPRKMCSGVFMDGKFYVIGGIGGRSDSKVLTCGEEYNLQTRTWTEIPNMSPGRSSARGGSEMPATAEAPPLVAVVNNELYAADYADMEVKKYDKERR